MTAIYYIHGKARYIGKSFHNIDFVFNYKNKITIENFYYFEDACLQYLKKQNSKIVDFKLSGWSRFDE